MDRNPNPHYAFGQLSKALHASAINATHPAHGAEAVAKSNALAETWRKIAQGMASGFLEVGTRTPIQGVPEWVTPKVVTGGFATGELLAEGPLQPHEEALLDRLGARGEANPRLFINSFYLTEQGMHELADMLGNGCYRIGVAEEGALLVIAWLLMHGKVTEAEAIMIQIQPWIGRLRFYPVPAPTPQAVSTIVSVAKVHDVRSALKAIHTPPKALKMKRSLEFWRPIEDEMVALFLQTLGAGEQPPMATYTKPPRPAHQLTPEFKRAASVRRPMREGSLLIDNTNVSAKLSGDTLIISANVPRNAAAAANVPKPREICLSGATVDGARRNITISPVGARSDKDRINIRFWQQSEYAQWLKLIRAASKYVEPPKVKTGITVTASGGTPCRTFPAGWVERVRAFLAKHQADFKKGDFPKKHPYIRVMQECLVTLVSGKTTEPVALPAPIVNRLRRILAEVNAAHGLPGSDRLAARRLVHETCLGSICAQDLAKVAVERLHDLPAHEGIDNVQAYIGPITAAEAAKNPNVKEGMALRGNIRYAIERARKEDLFELVRLGLVPSSEVLATLVWDISAQMRSSAFTDKALRQLYSLLYLAFRARRSLLLLNLGGQTRMSDLPWCAHLEQMRASLAAASGAVEAKEALAQVAIVALESYPETILPNKLIKEMRSLVQTAGLDLPLVDELAADIFQHAFSAKFVQAAARTAEMVRGTLYANYYGIPCEQLVQLGARQTQDPESKAPAQEFYNLCRTRAGQDGAGRGFTVSVTGTILEQEAVLTSHNLACLFTQLGLLDRIGRRLAALPRQCLAYVLKQLAHLPADAGAMFAAVRYSGFAWRQMVFFLSFVTPDERREFFAHAQQSIEALATEKMHTEPVDPAVAEKAAANKALAERLMRALRSLMAADNGGAVELVFYGWSVTSHWVLPPRK